MNWQVNYPKYCLLAAARQSNRQQVTQDWEESCVALDVRHWWRDRGACRSVTRLASIERRKGNKMWVPWQPRCPTRLRVCQPDLVNVGTAQAVVRAGVGRFLGGVIAAQRSEICEGEMVAGHLRPEREPPSCGASKNRLDTQWAGRLTG